MVSQLLVTLKVVYETGQLRGRLSTIATSQKEYTGSVTDVEKRMREYTHMLEQARGTIQSLERPKPLNELFIGDNPKSESSRKESVSSSKPVAFPALLEEEEEQEEEKVQEKPNISKKSQQTPDLYKHRIIRKRASNPEVTTSPWLPQKGLRILLNDFN